MAMAIVQVTLTRDGALPADNVVNTFHFEDDSGFSTAGGFSVNGPGLESRIETFYQAIAPWLSARLSGTGIIRMYDLQHERPRAPQREASFTFAPSASAYPSEVAVAMSFSGQRESGIEMGRRRGRVFLGPLGPANVSMDQTSDPADVRPSVGFLDALANNGRIMARGGQGSFRLAIFSPTIYKATQSYDQALTDAHVITVDNAFDIIRSRGSKATLRRAVRLSDTSAPTTVTSSSPTLQASN
jgi:hypothetical protein